MTLTSIHHDTVQHINDHWIQLSFAIGFALAIIADLWLVATGRKTISWRTWLAERAHPILQAFGVLVGVGCCWLLRESWPSVMVTGICIGHLAFSSELSDNDPGIEVKLLSVTRPPPKPVFNGAPIEVDPSSHAI